MNVALALHQRIAEGHALLAELKRQDIQLQRRIRGAEAWVALVQVELDNLNQNGC